MSIISSAENTRENKAYQYNSQNIFCKIISFTNSVACNYCTVYMLRKVTFLVPLYLRGQTSS